jgi:hypothetical protein
MLIITISILVILVGANAGAVDHHDDAQGSPARPGPGH